MAAAPATRTPTVCCAAAFPLTVAGELDVALAAALVADEARDDAEEVAEETREETEDAMELAEDTADPAVEEPEEPLTTRLQISEVMDCVSVWMLV
jgi:hypothetical protein